jgi:hypothetical protein
MKAAKARQGKYNTNSTGCTHAHACNVRPGVVQKWYHVPPLGDRTLETRVERIAGEEGEEGGLVRVFGSGSVLVDDGLEARRASYRLCGSGSRKRGLKLYTLFRSCMGSFLLYMVNVVVV